MTEREELEYRLENKYLNKIVSYQLVTRKVIHGKVDRVFVETDGEDFMIGFIIDRTLYKTDKDYINENLILL